MKDKISQAKWIEITILLLVLIPHLAIAFGNQVNVLNWYTNDDAFYYFTVARNIAEGNGVTFDGLNPTNGFHPLWLLLNIPVFALARINPVLPLRVLILVSALLHAGSGILLFRLGKRFFAAWIAVLIALGWVLFPPIHHLTAQGGVEAGLNAFFVTLLWKRLSAFNTQEAINQRDLNKIVGLGVLATLTIFSRLDNVFLVFFAGTWLWLRWWGLPTGKSGNGWEHWRWRIKTGLAFFGPITLVMTIYLFWNYMGFGTLTPVSGQVKVGGVR